MSIDLVEHPPHYTTAAGIEAIEVIEHYGLGYHLGNAIKYLLRAGRKEPSLERQDLAKARWYLNRWQAGVYERYGVDLPAVSDQPGGGVAWATPAMIADAFALQGARRVAAVAVLHAACMFPDDNIAKALAALDGLLGDAP